MHRPEDGKWVKLYNSLFIVMNERKEIVSWQQEKFDVVSDLVANLRNRTGLNPCFFVIDNCCKWERKLKDLFGSSIAVKLDLFHAVQRLTSTIDKRHRYHRAFCKHLRGIFRQTGDKERDRLKPTATPEDIERNIGSVIKSWESIESVLHGTSLLNANFRNAVENLLRHVRKGCLSGIPPGLSTGMNENLHKHLNRIFKGMKMGPELALNLLTLFFFVWNCKRVLTRQEKKVVKSSICSPGKIRHSRSEKFGIGVSDRQPKSSSAGYSLATASFTVDELFMRKCFLFKRLRFLSWTEPINMEIFFCEEYSSKFLQMASVRNPGYGFTSLVDRCKNFGFSPINTIALNENDCSKLISVLTQTITSYINENRNFSAIRVHFEKAGFTEDLGRNFKVLKIALHEQMKKRSLEERAGCTIDPRLAHLLAKDENFMEAGLADLVLQTIADVIGVSIVIFTSLIDIPFFAIITKVPLITSQWLYIGVSYDEKVAFFTLTKCYDVANSQTSSSTIGAKKRKSGCCCGSKENKLDLPKCISLPGAKYSSRCPCFKAQEPCNGCSCRGCKNSFGESVVPKVAKLRTGGIRRKPQAQLNVSFKRSDEYLTERGESLPSGQWTDEESFLLRQCMAQATENDHERLSGLYNRGVNIHRKNCMNLREKAVSQVRAKASILTREKELVLAKIVASTMAIFPSTQVQ